MTAALITSIQPPFITQKAAELFETIDSKKVEAIGVTGQMHTVIFVDREGKSIRPALMWNDTRTANLIPKLRKKIQMINEVSYISNIISTGSPAANLFWLPSATRSSATFRWSKGRS